MKILLLYLLCFLHPNFSFTQNLPNASETLVILNKTYNFKFKDFYASEISKTLKTKEFKLVTREFYGKLILKKVLEIKAEKNGLYEYEILEPYKTKYVLHSNAKLKTVTVKLINLYLINAGAARIQGNSVIFGASFEYDVSPFYDPDKYPESVSMETAIPNIEIIQVNKQWRIRDSNLIKSKFLRPGLIFN